MPECLDQRWTAADALRCWPHASEVFRHRRLACPGCSLAAFDTLGEVASAYGLDLPLLLDEVGSAAKGNRPQD